MDNRSNLYTQFVCMVSAMGGLLFGYDWVVIGGAKPFYEMFFSISDDPVMQGVAMTTALVGCLIGAMVAGAMADKYGRKPLLLLSAVLFTVSAITTGLFDNFVLFNIARFVGGIGIGVASALSPMYIAEIAPAHIRGRMVSLNQMTIVLGILAAQLVNMLIGTGAEADWGRIWGWRLMFWAETVPAALFLVMALFIPESPVYLRLKYNKKMNGGKEDEGGLKELLQKKYSKVLLLGVVIAVFQQWCGTNVIFNYAQEIFVSAGFDVDGMFINIVITGIANVVFTIIALYTIEQWGRRTLMLLGASGLGIIYLVLGICYAMEMTGVLMVALVVAAISVYAMTLGPVTWTLLAEIFPHRVRGIAMAVCTFALWTGCCTLTFSFPSMNVALGSSGTFWTYSVICFCAFIFMFRNCPETRKKSWEQLEKELIP